MDVAREVLRPQRVGFDVRQLGTAAQRKVSRWHSRERAVEVASVAIRELGQWLETTGDGGDGEWSLWPCGLRGVARMATTEWSDVYCIMHGLNAGNGCLCPASSANKVSTRKLSLSESLDVVRAAVGRVR